MAPAKGPLFSQESYATACSACSHVRVSQERQSLEFSLVKSTRDLSGVKLNSVRRMAHQGTLWSLPPGSGWAG